jgi:hypothetical protein
LLLCCLCDQSAVDYILHISKVIRQKTTNVFLNRRQVIAGGIVVRCRLVTRNDDVVQIPQRIVGLERFLREDVESGAGNLF